MSTQIIDAKYIRSLLLGAGITPAGAAGVLGNFEAESGIVSCRMQGDFQTGFVKSQTYAKNVSCGIITEDAFANDSIGFGLAQWTYPSRKRALLQYAKQTGQFIGDAKPQVEFFLKELQGEYLSVWRTLRDGSDVLACSNAMLLNFERPADMSVSAQNYRFSLSQKWFTAFSDAEGINTLGEAEATQEAPIASQWPPREIDKSMSGDDVAVLQAVLIARGYDVEFVDGSFDGTLDAAVRKFQKDQGLKVDGVVGKNTWAAVLKI